MNSKNQEVTSSVKTPPVSAPSGVIFRRSGKTIFQLAKVSRRLPRLVTRASKRLRFKKLTPQGRAFCHYQIAGARQAGELLKAELQNRNVFGVPFRDATPLRLQRLQASAILKAA